MIQMQSSLDAADNSGAPNNTIWTKQINITLYWFLAFFSQPPWWWLSIFAALFFELLLDLG